MTVKKYTPTHTRKEEEEDYDCGMIAEDRHGLGMNTEDDGDGDADQDGRVVRLGADGLGPGGLAELVFAGEGPDLKIIISELTIHYSLILLRPAQPRICESRKYCVARTSNLIPRKLIFEPRHKNLVGKSLP